jgi:threonylcarbamoyladenosine tRNA methylthiotransferase MtaB
LKFFIHTTGCKANQWDSHVIAGRLKARGLKASSMADADFIIVNGCTVTEGAVRDIRRFFNRARDVNPSGTLVLAGCHAQVYPEDNFGAHLVLGQGEKFHIDEFLGRRGIFVGGNGFREWERGFELDPVAGKTRFFLKIQDGCDKYCTYCIVPFARGAPRSRPSQEIISAMAGLAQRGVPEVVLTGIEIGSYRDSVTGTDLAGLVKCLDDVRTPPRIRISSVDPAAIDDPLIRAMAQSSKVARSLHLPVQSGSNTILRRMGRRHTTKEVVETIEKVVSRIDNVGIGLDIIAGFPGESDEEFDETLQFIESLPVYYLHVFPFSPRSGTAAASFPDAVPDAVKRERVRRLRELDGRKRKVFYQRFLGSEVHIIPETKVYRGSFLRGYSNNYVPVYVPARGDVANKLVRITIKEIRDGMVLGDCTG